MKNFITLEILKFYHTSLGGVPSQNLKYSMKVSYLNHRHV